MNKLAEPLVHTFQPIEDNVQKWLAAAEKAHGTARMANTLAKALASRYARRWRFVDFLGPNGHESAGIVDIVALRKCGQAPDVAGLKRLDLFDIQLIQVKGGSAAWPTAEERQRLRLVQKHYRAQVVVLFCWRKGKEATFHTLVGDEWHETTASALFAA